MTSPPEGSDLSVTPTYDQTVQDVGRTPSTGTGNGSTKDVAKDQAADVKDSAVGAASNVAGTARDQAGEVAGEARRQARDLLHEGRSQLHDQAGEQQQRAAQGLRSIGDELRSMADGSQQQGMASDLAHQAAERVNSVAQWLDGREPGQLLDDVRGFARQRPMTFLAIAAGAGVVAGRLGRGLQADASGSTSGATSGSTSGATSGSGSMSAGATTPATTAGVSPAAPTYGTAEPTSTPPTGVMPPALPSGGLADVPGGSDTGGRP
ncbi:MAG: hypothetical protein ACTHLJ_12450 [Angustibacter sp.]